MSFRLSRRGASSTVRTATMPTSRHSRSGEKSAFVESRPEHVLDDHQTAIRREHDPVCGERPVGDALALRVEIGERGRQLGESATSRTPGACRRGRSVRVKISESRLPSICVEISARPSSPSRRCSDRACVNAGCLNDARRCSESRSVRSNPGAFARAGRNRSSSSDAAAVLSNINKRSPRPSEIPCAYQLAIGAGAVAGRLGGSTRKSRARCCSFSRVDARNHW